ncbi:Mu transposase C-terminal domain-containing protein [Streptomyces sp. AgN23]|uniref:Mu transposase C-terminal domain-containing protein n=1 Tax=Streptomyces sp. AgN23 TaxID=1188315 RepID=UPI001B32CED4|nr:Mu transposase C-terminal domain-containing protein [Streptomyces sp. AgN23]QTI87236.1 Mu transposase C-terminal domain-containing protein [Streptomyces sp. AgN23]
MRAELPPGTHPRLLRPEGIHWRGRLYHASWITGQVTAQVVVRPHASPGDGIDVYHPSGRRLGTALPITLASTEGTPMTDTTGTETAAADASGAEPDFYLNLADARIVATEALLEAGRTSPIPSTPAPCPASTATPVWARPSPSWPL